MAHFHLFNPVVEMNNYLYTIKIRPFNLRHFNNNIGNSRACFEHKLGSYLQPTCNTKVSKACCIALFLTSSAKRRGKSKNSRQISQMQSEKRFFFIEQRGMKEMCVYPYPCSNQMPKEQAGSVSAHLPYSVTPRH